MHVDMHLQYIVVHVQVTRSMWWKWTRGLTSETNTRDWSVEFVNLKRQTKRSIKLNPFWKPKTTRMTPAVHTKEKEVNF